MSETVDTALALAKKVVTGFKTGAAAAAPAGKAGAEAAYVPPKFPVEPEGDQKECGRLPATKAQSEANYAKQLLEEMAQRTPDKAGDPPVLSCCGSLHISLFFDGTCCNQDNADDEYGSSNPPLTNIGKLYHAANWNKSGNGPADDGYFSYYFPGCGARFPDIGEKNYTLNGELFANGGEDRINQALLKTFSSIVYAVTKTRIEDKKLNEVRGKMATTWPVSLVTTHFNRKKALEAFCEEKLGSVVTQWPLQPTREYIQKAQKRIPKIKLFVYGYCRGASTARVFTNWLAEMLDNTPMPITATNSAPAGAKLSPGPTLLGIPISIEFLGLLDSVSSVGVPHILPSATGHMAWAANSLQLPKTAGFVKNCYHFIAGQEQHGDLPLDSVRGPDGKYPAGAIEVVYPGVHADVGGDCKPTELGKVQTDSRELLSQIVLHDMYAAAFAAGAPLGVPEDVLPGGAKDKPYRKMNDDVLEKFKISSATISSFNAWQATAQQSAPAAPAKEGALDEAAIAAAAAAAGKDPYAAVKQAKDAAAKQAAGKPGDAPQGAQAASDSKAEPGYAPLKAKALETLLADQLSWITAWRIERFTSPEFAAKHYQVQPFYQQAKNDAAAAAPSAGETSTPRFAPLIDKDRLDRAAGQFDRGHGSILALLAQVGLDIIPGKETDQLGGKIVSTHETGYMQIKKSGDARRTALMASPQVMDFYDNYVHDTQAKYNHDPLHSSLLHGYFAPRTVYDTDDDNWDSVKQFGQRINGLVNIHIGDIVTAARTDLKDPSTVSGVLGKIYRDIKNDVFKTLLP